MTRSGRAGGSPEAPLSRRERRAIARAERAEQPRAPRKASGTSAWRSPMVLFTVGALAVGLAIIAFAVFGRPGAGPTTDDLTNPLSNIPAELADGRTLGRADAPVTIEIWSDFQCPACRTLAMRTEPSIITDFVVPGTVKFVYRDAAFQGARGSNPNYDESVEPAAAARCAADQGRFWQMHDWLFANWDGENEGAFRAARLRLIAEAAGLELGAYDACMATGDQQAAVRSETAAGLSSGVDSTPTMFINGTPIVGAPTPAELSAAASSWRRGDQPARSCPPTAGHPSGHHPRRPGHHRVAGRRLPGGGCAAADGCPCAARSRVAKRSR